MSITRHPLFDDPRSIAPAPLDEALVARLETSFRGLAAKADALVERFYGRLFRREPGLRAMFPTDMAAQKVKLVDTLAFVVGNLRAPDKVLPRLKELGASHAGYGARAGHYPIVCEELLGAMAETAGETWDEDTGREWGRALALVSAAMLSGAN
jgi:hemoglobin-like flavoprotein